MKKRTRKQYSWTEAQIDFIMSKPDDISWPKYTEMMNATFNVSRNAHTVYQKYYTLIKSNDGEEEPVETKEVPPVINEPKEKRFARTRKRWTPQEELEVLVDFYSLSVDEARERWERPYVAIAGRLESICDETEPHHNALLMEAANIIRMRNDMMRKPSRKERKALKRAAKVAKKQARLARKMEKLGSE